MRKPRVLCEGARYHVVARITRHEMALGSTKMRELFLEIVKRAMCKYDFLLENFCVMGNHFHFIIRPGKGESLSRIMQWIMSVFAMRFNKIHGYWGPVWGSRFFSRILANLREFMLAFEYIDLNPVKAKLVRFPWEWPHGGLRHARDGCLEIIKKNDSWIIELFPSHGPLLLTDASTRTS